MFGTWELSASVLRYAPQVLLRQLPSFLVGIVAGYCTVLLFFGPLPLLSGVLQLILTVAISKGLAAIARVGITKGISLFEERASSGAGKRGHVNRHKRHATERGGVGNERGTCDAVRAVEAGGTAELD
ncbi:hypothetical protein TcYC6_0086360 [Trypanosoma cruzi]|nr:hypothetical protein TcYC6_0086360 [Trypanosoma cruzi]